MKTISDNIKYALKINNFSQKKLSELIGVNQNTISQYCSNTREPDLATIYKICKALNFSPNELFNWDDEETK